MHLAFPLQDGGVEYLRDLAGGGEVRGVGPGGGSDYGALQVGG